MTLCGDCAFSGSVRALAGALAPLQRRRSIVDHHHPRQAHQYAMAMQSHLFSVVVAWCPLLCISSSVTAIDCASVHADERPDDCAPFPCDACTPPLPLHYTHRTLLHCALNAHIRHTQLALPSNDIGLSTPPSLPPASHRRGRTANGATAVQADRSHCSSSSLMATYSRITTIPGEYEVAHLTDIVHLNSVESVTGVAGGGALIMANGGGGHGAIAGATGSGVDSWLHASVSAQAQSAFWKGNLHLSNYQLSFLVSDGAHAGHHALGYHSADHPHAHALQPLHPNLDASNFSLLHVPVGSIFKMEYSKHAAFAPPSKKEKAAGEGDYSSYSGDSYSVAAASAAAAAADSTLRDIEFQLQITTRDARVLSFGILRRASLASAGIIAAGAGSSTASGSDATAQSAEDRAASVAEFLRLLKKYAFPKETRKLFAFSYMSGGRGAGGDARGAGGQSSAAEGWACYDVVREFARMGLGVHPADAARGLSLVHPRRRAQWRLDTVTNARFEFSPTYPQAYWLPAALTEKELGKVKGFRSKARIPALVYNYSDLLDYQGLGLNAQSYPDTVILRAAQPNVGSVITSSLC